MLKFGRQTATDSAKSSAGSKTPDGEEQLKRRARQRLVGALILVLTTVIVLPMVLDSEPRPVNSGIEISIPAKDVPFEPKLDTAPPAASVSAAPSTPVAAAPVVPPPLPSAPSAPAPDAAPAVVAEPPAAKPVEAKAAEKTPEKKPEKKPAEQKPAESKPADKKPADAKPAVTDGAKAQALLDGKLAADKTVDKTVDKPSAEKSVVQIGAFASADKVRELQSKLKAAGIATYTEKIKTDAGERIRLRAGPFSQRADAQAMLAKIDAAGVHGAKVVAP